MKERSASRPSIVPGAAGPDAGLVRGPWSQLGALLPWAIAAGLAVVGLWLGQRAMVARSELALARTEQALADLGLRAARQAREAERIVAQQQIETANRQVAQAQQSLAASSGQISRQLAETRDRAAQLTADLQAQGDLAQFKIATLAPMGNTSADALAVAVWNPGRQEGMFALEKSPPLPPGHKLELWVIEAKEGARPVSAGVFAVNVDGPTKLRFKPNAPVGAVARFAVSREQDDGARHHPQPGEWVMIGAAR